MYRVGDSETIIEHQEFIDNLMKKLSDGLDGDVIKHILNLLCM